MNGPERRRAILRLLAEEDAPVKGGTLADAFEVSRQAIVQDVAILRAEGERVMATPQGYVLLGPKETSLVRTVVTRHGTDRQMEEELLVMVRSGATVLKVIVEHPLYGEITGNLMLSTESDVDYFMEKVRTEGGKPLSSLTDGVHLHTLELPDEAAWETVLRGLRDLGYLLDER
ncbi:MAG TPA: transcription repressor NadR [Synergistaceae bacterium]|jgi:hypothetical protein|nr:transcription repressor NadR [Synergistaceae bacterium]